MKQEEYLDRLIERQEYRGNRHPVSNPEITTSLAAVEWLTRLREIDVPADFARRLEVSLRARTRMRHPQGTAAQMALRGDDDQGEPGSNHYCGISPLPIVREIVPTESKGHG